MKKDNNPFDRINTIYTNVVLTILSLGILIVITIKVIPYIW